VFVTVLGYLVLNESMNLAQATGGLLIIISVILIQKSNNKIQKKTFLRMPFSHVIIRYQRIYFLNAISSIIFVESDLGLSIGYPRARSQIILDTTPIARPILKSTV